MRELENIIERAVALASGQMIGLGDLPREISGAAAQPTPALLELPAEGFNLDDVLGEVERRILLQALERTGGVRTNAARLLGVTLRSLRYRLQKHALDVGILTARRRRWRPSRRSKAQNRPRQRPRDDNFRSSETAISARSAANERLFAPSSRAASAGTPLAWTSRRGAYLHSAG